MRTTMLRLPLILVLLTIFLGTDKFRQVCAQPVPDAVKTTIEEKSKALREAVEELRKKDPDTYLLADVEVYLKAVDWCVRHQEFYAPRYAEAAAKALETGLRRATELAQEKSPWDQQPGSLVRGYLSAVDGSVQPYAVKLPPSFAEKADERWPLHVHLHGRGDQMNEVDFIRQHDGAKVDPEQTWIQLDVYGRANNGYRWAGETDVFEALAAVKKRYRIDAKRIVLRGFSMGGAGSWHLGLHHPSTWCSVGPGAGFVDFYGYQKVPQKLPAYQDDTLKIYDSLDYAMNGADVPICTYGGELDPQVAASKAMAEAMGKLEIPLKVLIGPATEHKFHPESFKEYMAFHLKHQEAGRPGYPGLKKIRFITYTPRYNVCEWLTIEEQLLPYKPSVVEGEIDADNNLLRLKTQNVSVLRIARDVADAVEIDGTRLELTNAAQGLLPTVYFQAGGDGWGDLSYDTSLGFNKNLDFRKRPKLQGPIDDAFMEAFVCVRPTGKPWSESHAAWASWTLQRFEAEFDRFLRGKVQVIDDKDLTDEIMAQKNLILFGDPGSNSVMKKMINRLPVKWSEEKLTVDGKDYDPNTHGVAMIYLNPMQPKRYVVINSGHTFHEPQFKASNAQLYPRLGDIAVLKFEKQMGEPTSFKEDVQWAAIFNSSWRLPKPIGKE